MGHAAGSAQHVCCYVLQTEEMDDSTAAAAEHILHDFPRAQRAIKPTISSMISPRSTLLKVRLLTTLNVMD